MINIVIKQFLGAVFMRSVNNNKKTSIMLVLIMILTPVLSLQTNMLDEGTNSLDNNIKFNTQSTNSIVDCELTNVSITEVYHHSSNEWIEIYNNGNQTCDLGEWIIGNSGYSFEIANNTNISSNNHLLFIRGTDFSFDISCNDQLLISTRDIEYANATEITALDCYGPNDDYHYDPSSDGSWEFCDGSWDWNEADEATQNATNLCAGNPFTLSALLGNGTWSHNPISVENGSSTLAWNVSNLDEGVEYRLYSSWNTGLTSFSRSYYFDGGIDEIAFDMFSDIDWTCEVYFYAYIVNESSNIIEEYFQKNMDVSACPNGELTYLLDGTIGIQNGHNFSAGHTSLTTISSGIDPTLEYIVEIKLIQDNTITDWNNEECNYSSNSNCEALVDNLIIYHETCILEFTSTLYVKSPYGWINILSGILEGDGPCDSDSDDISGPIKLYANMTDSNGIYSYQEVTSDNYELNTNDTNTHNFYWAFPLSSYGNEYRFHSYFDGETVFDLNYYSFIIGEDTVDGVDSYELHWNATSSGQACSPSIWAYMYIQSPSGSSNSLDSWYQNMQVNDCNSFGEVELYNNGVNPSSDNDLLDGTNNMSWNLTELDIGREYVLEWYSSRSSSYTNNDNSVYGEYYNKTIFIANSENNTIDWTINAHGSWCDLDISFRLHTPLTTQDWQDSFEEGNYPYFTSKNYDLDPVCDGSDIPEYNPVSLFYNDSGTWNEVNESTNLSAGIYDMKWEINGGSDWSATPNLVLSTSYETFLNSSTQSRTYYNEGDSSWEEHWELIISDWSCNIDFDYDLDIILYSNNHYSVDEDKNNPFIEGPCNDPIDVSSSNSNQPSHNLYILLGNSTNPLDSQDSLDEGENTIRWKVENTVSDYEHMLHAYLHYNGNIQEFTFDNFLGNGSQIVGDFNFELEGDICSIQFYSNLYIKEYNTWNSIDSSYTSLSYDGNTSDCDYQENQIGFSVLDDTGNWNNSMETLTPGIHQVRFDMGDLIENVTYYISSSINGQGSQSQHFNGYFSIGQPTINSNDLNDYFGQDIYHNITVNPWTCSINYYANLYYISPTGSWSTYRGISSSIEVENCESAGEISISSLVDNQWIEEIDVYNYPLETGLNDLYWNMTNLNVGETYQLYFYAYKDNIQIYNNIGDIWVANSTLTSWHFPVTIEGDTCNFYAYAYLRILNDEGFNDLDYTNFYPEEPCTPNFDINFNTDSSSVWFDAQTENLPVGTTQMMFNLSELGEGDYEIDYYWHSDNGNSMNWDYDNYFTVDENNNGFYWNITLEKLDCSVFLDLQVYDRSYGGNYQIGNYNDILLQGPCMLPFDLDVNGVEFDNQDGNPDLSLGDNDMTWTFDNLDTGINYYLYFNWYNGSNGYSENYYFTYNESNDYTWTLPIGDWDCNPYVYATLYYADNGTHIFGNEWFYFNVPECYSVWIDHTDSDGDYMDSDDLSNGSNDMSWNIYDLPEGYEFALEMRTYMNGYMQEYSYELFNDSGNVSIDFSIDVDTYSVCDVRVETTLFYLDSDGNWDSVTSNSRYFYQSCDLYESMYPWTVLVDMDADGNYSEVSQYDNIGGNGTIPMMLDLSNLADDEIYRVQHSWYTSLDSEYFNWEDVTSTNNQFYFDVPVSNWDCEVRLYVYIQYETFQGYDNHMISTNQYFNTDCLEPGNVSLNMDNMGEVWDDWSNLNNGTNDMSWEITDLIVGETYTIDWYVKYNNDIVSYEYLTWTAGDSDESVQWSFDMDNSTTCNVEIMYRMFVDSGDSNWVEMDNEYFYWYPSCDQWVYPRDHYFNLNVEINGTMVENPETLPSGEVDFEIHFENMSVGADYRMYFYYSNTGFNSNSQYIYFTYDGSPMEMTIDIAPWACSVYFNYDMRLYDFRYDSGNSYNDWYLGSESRYIDGPCETLNYDSSDYPNFTVTDDVGNDIDDETDFSTGNNTIILGADNLQNEFPYYMELQVRYDGYLNVFKTHTFTGNNTTAEEFAVTFDIPGHVCNVEVRSYFYVITSSGSNQLNYTNYYADGPCDGADGESRLSTPLHAYINGTWVEVDDDTFFPAGETEMSWDLSALDSDTYYYMNFNGPNTGWGGYFYGDNIPEYLSDWSMTLSEFRCDVSIYNDINAISDYTGWNGFSSQYFYPDNDCLDGGDITLEAQDDEGNWSSLTSYGFDLLPGTTNFSWSLDNLLEGYDYEFYWYQQGSDYVSEYQYFTADSNGSESVDFSITIDQYECSVYFYAYLRPMSEYTDMYEETESFSFWPNTPCYPPFNFAAEDAAGNLTVDALDSDFVLSPGDNHLFFDFNHMDNGTTYYLQYYWSSQYSWNGWYYEYVYVNTTDNVSDGLHFNMTLDSMECYAYVYVSVYNYSNGNSYHMGDYNIDLEGPCMLPFDLDVNGVEFDNQDGNPDLSLGDNDMTWTFDNLDTGINYYLYFNWYNGSNGYSENYYFTYNESNDYTWTLPIGDWDCNPYVYATLYYADNGTHIFGNEWFYFNVPECYSVWIDHTDSDGDYMDSDDLSNGSNDMSWNIYDLPEGYEFALEMRTYMNGYMQEYSYELFNDSGNVSIDFSIDVDTYSVCDVRVETTLFYLDSDGNWDSVTSNSRYFYQSCDLYESMYPWTVLVDMDADGNYSEVSQYDNIGGNGTIPMMLDLSNLADDEIYRVQHSWYTSLDSEYFNWEDVTSTNNQFYFDVPVSNWDCEVRLYVYIQYETFQGYDNHMISTNQYFNTDCLEPGNVSLNMDNMGEVWDDWSNLNNGTNDMSWEITDLIVGETYTIDWYVKYNNDIVSYEYLTWTAGDSDESVQWSFDMDNSTTCNVEIMYRMFVDSGDSNWVEMDNEYFYWYPSCDQWVYPRDHYFNLNVEINGTMVENPETLPSGEVDFEIHFENMSVGADYRMYFYYSNTGFNSNSQYIYFTYDGSPMEMTIDIAPWACSVYFNYDMRLYDFRYDSGNSYNDWYLGSESRYIDGPCETLNYDSSDYPNFTVTDDVGNDIDDETDFSTGNNTIILGADNLQNEFPYYMELQVRYDGYLNVFKTHTFTGNNTTAEEFAVTFDIPGHVCNVEVRSYFYVITSSGSNQLNYTNYYADGPCDGADGESRLSTPLHAYINGTWVEVDDDTFFPAGETEMSWDLSALDSDTYYYMNFNGPNTGWGGYFYGDNIPEYLSDWSMTLSEFRCDVSIYNDINAISDYTGWNGFSSQYFYPDNDCLDGGDITLEAQDDEGNWSSLTSYGFDLLPGTTNFSWSLDNLLEGYDYEFYWYQQGSDYVSEYQYFTADSNGSESVDFSITIDQYECSVYFYAYLRPMSEYTDMYEETESFSFWPNTPCYPPFNFAAEDAAGNLTVDALDSDFVLSPGDNHLFFDFNHMDNGTTYYLQYYWSSQYSWNGWYYEYVYVNTTDNVSDGLHFNMTLDSMECYAYVYVSVYNYSNGNSYHMGDYNIDLEGPCMLPFDLDVPSNEGEVEIGVNNLTWNIDNLDVGSNYTFQYYYSMNSGFYGWYNYEFTYNESESFDFTINVTEWDCNININANMYNSTDGNMNYIYGNSLNLYNPNCYQVDYYALDEGGDWIQYNNIDAGTSELFWEINYFNENVPSGHEFKLEYQIIIDNDWANPTQSHIIWTQDDDATQQLPWNITINEFVCDVYVTSSLYVNTSNGWSNVRGNGFNLYAPCEPMPSGWYNFSMNDNGTWNQFYDGWNHMIQEEGVYEMRWNVMDLEIGITYEMSWVAHAFGHELSSYSMQWNATDSNGTLDFNINIPHWYCGMEFESKLSFDNNGTMFEIASNYYYEEGPCDDSIEEFTDAFSVDLDLIIINDNLYSQDYELMIPFGYILNDEIKLYLDAVFGNMDGILNASEATMAENSFNSQTDVGEETPPEFALNGVNLTSFTFNPAILSNLTGTPTFTGSWILEYFNIYGVEITSTIEIESEDEIEWYFNILENLDMTVESIQVTDSENVYSILTPSFILTSGNYSLNITWLLANIQDPILELEQLDMVSEEFDELTNIMDESFNENMTIHTFQINLTNLSYQEYVITYNVHIDEYYEDNATHYIYQEVNNDITSFNLLSNIHTCSALISIEVYDRNNEQVLSENYTLMGTCQPYDYDMDGVSDEDDAFPYDSTEWLDTDGDGYGDNSDVFPNDATEWLDTDSDGIGNNADTDDDGDGLDDEFDNDNDGDGVVNDDDIFPEDPTEWNDTDSDGYGDNSDVFPNDASEWEDSDGDGIGDNSDDDADGDGVPNDVDDLPLNPGESSDSDGDGVGNNQDAFPNNPDEQIDTDGDGIGDNSDDDDDGDGVVDESDAFPLDSTESMDSDDDGFGDNKDTFPNNPNETTDSDGDNVGDNADVFPSNFNEWADSDGDGVGDNADVFPNDLTEWLDSDGDNVGDNADVFPSNLNEWADSDGDGVGDNADVFPNDLTEWLDSDGDNVGDNSDTFPNDNTETVDTDGDGVGDNAQAAAEAESGGFLPGFSSITGLVSILGAAILVAGRRKD